MAEVMDINKNILEKAKLVASKIEDVSIRKRVYALNIAANLAAEYITNAGLETDTALSLFRIPSFAKHLEFADIYINGLRLDVRISFDGKTFCIPKSQEIYDAKPYAYVVLKLEKGLKSAEILGFAPADSLEKTETKTEYYGYNTDILRPMEELRVFLSTIEFKQHIYSSVEHEKIKELCTAFIDDQISETEKIYFMKHVIACPVCRETFCDMNDFDVIVSQVKNYEELLNDSTLSVLSGNKKEFDEAALAGMALVENAQEILEDDTVETPIEEDQDIVRPMGAISPEETEDELVQNNEEEILPEETTESDINEFVDVEDDLILNEDTEEIVDLNFEDASEENSDILDTTDNLNNLEEIAQGDEIEIQPADDNLTSIEEISPLDELDDLTTSNQDIVNTDSLNSSQEENLLIEETPIDELAVDNDSLNDLEIKEHETLEAIDDVEPLEQVEQINTLEDKNSDISIDPIDLDEIAPLEELPNEVKNSGENEDTLKETESIDLAEIKPLNDEPEERKIKEEVVSYAQEPVELVYDDEDSEDNPIEEKAEETIVQNTEQGDEPAEEKTDSEIQGLLDDDLLALLSENNEENPNVEQNTLDATAENDEDSESTFEEDMLYFEDSNSDSEKENFEDFQKEENTIESLYSETNVPNQDAENPTEFELAQEPVSAKTVNATKKIITGLALVLILAGGSVVSWYFNHAKTMQNNALDTANQDGEFFDLQNKGSNSEETPAVSQDINKSMTNSFSDKPAAITITKLSWQVSEKLASEASVKEYLQTAGKNIQMNLQNDLMNSTDLNFNNVIKVSFEIAPDNTLKGIQVLESSGSDQVDDIVVRSIKNTLKYVSVPKLKDMKSDYFLTLIINF